MTSRHTSGGRFGASQTRGVRLVGVVVFVIAQAGCVGALPGARRSFESETYEVRTAFASVEEVDVVVQYGNWPLPPRVDRYLTPVHVVVQKRRNRSQPTPIHDLSLVGHALLSAAIPFDSQAVTNDYGRTNHSLYPSRFVGARHVAAWMSEQATATGAVGPGGFVDGRVSLEPLLGSPQEYELRLVLSAAEASWVGAAGILSDSTGESRSVSEGDGRPR